MRGRLVFVVMTSALACGAFACDRLDKLTHKDDPPPEKPPEVLPPITQPPVADKPVGIPLEEVDASQLDMSGLSALEQAKVYESRGQLWVARLIIEKTALAPSATRDETETLARICTMQGDTACVTQCSIKLGKPFKWDGGAPKRSDGGAPEHKEPDSDLARARAYLLKKQPRDAKAILEPKLLNNTATKEEIRMLKKACQDLSEAMCIMACDSKLR